MHNLKPDSPDSSKHKKARLTPEAIKRQLAKCEALGVTDAVRAINHSIEHGYTGLFEADGAFSVTGIGRRVISKSVKDGDGWD